jgi:hypothetical protein
LPFVYLQTLLRLDDELQAKLVTDIEALKPSFPATASNAPSVVGKDEFKRRNSVTNCGMLASEFAYHGLAPAHLKEMHQARELLDQIYTDIKKSFLVGVC